jgi:DNA repair protein RecO (recombination protein O)
MLTEESGIVRATVFGGPKSRLRSYASPFHSGQAWIYRDPAKTACKLSDFDVRCWRPGIREMYERAMAADAVAETLLASHAGGGNWPVALSLAEAVLDAMETAGGEDCRMTVMWFMWQWAQFLGIRPDMDKCCACGRPVEDSGRPVFSPSESGMICARCHGANTGLHPGCVPAGPGCRLWLRTVESRPLSKLASFTMDRQSFAETRALTQTVLACAIGKKLSSWEW